VTALTSNRTPCRSALSLKPSAVLLTHIFLLRRNLAAKPSDQTQPLEHPDVPRGRRPRTPIGFLDVLVARPPTRQVLGNDPFLPVVQGRFVRRIMRRFTARLTLDEARRATLGEPIAGVGTICVQKRTVPYALDNTDHADYKYTGSFIWAYLSSSYLQAKPAGFTCTFPLRVRSRVLRKEEHAPEPSSHNQYYVPSPSAACTQPSCRLHKSLLWTGRCSRYIPRFVDQQSR